MYLSQILDKIKRDMKFPNPDQIDTFLDFLYGSSCQVSWRNIDCENMKNEINKAQRQITKHPTVPYRDNVQYMSVQSNIFCILLVRLG